MDIRIGHSVDLLQDISLKSIDLVVTDPPYAFGGNGTEHEISASVAIVLRECALRVKTGCWMLVFCASSWRSIAYMVESVRGIMQPVRIGTWTKPASKTKVKTVGWDWASVSVVALRKGPKNDPRIIDGCSLLDHHTSEVITGGRRAELPASVCDWAISPFVIPGGVFLDPFAGSGALPLAAERLGMMAIALEIDSEVSMESKKVQPEIR